MRLIDADKLLAQVKATDCLSHSDVVRIVKNAPTILEWHSMNKQIPVDDDTIVYLVTPTGDDFHVCSYLDGAFREYDWRRCEYVEIDGVRWWAEILYPDEV